MATPKHKIQRYRRDARRAANALKAVVGTRCPKCSEEKRPHHVCQNCGYYKGHDALKIQK